MKVVRRRNVEGRLNDHIEVEGRLHTSYEHWRYCIEARKHKQPLTTKPLGKGSNFSP